MSIKKLVIMVLCCCIFLCGCREDMSNYVTKEEYNEISKEKDQIKEEYEKYISDNERGAIDFFSYNESINVSESEYNGKKSLIIFYYLPVFTDGNDISEAFSDFGLKLVEAKLEDWFDYDYVMIDVWNDSFGRIVSLTIDAKNLNTYMQSHNWYEASETEFDRNTESTLDNANIIYQDENIIVQYNGISGSDKEYKINFIIENLTDKTLTIQFRETSINGFMVNPIGSIEIASGKKAKDGMTMWGNEAKEYPMDKINGIETKFYVFSDDRSIRYESEDVVVR